MWKVMSADGKANIKQQKIKDLVVYLKRKYLQNLKSNIKRGRIFHLILVCNPFVLILSVKNRVLGGVLLNGQNLLSVTKIICRQSHRDPVKCLWWSILWKWLTVKAAKYFCRKYLSWMIESVSKYFSGILLKPNLMKFKKINNPLLVKLMKR